MDDDDEFKTSIMHGWSDKKFRTTTVLLQIITDQNFWRWKIRLSPNNIRLVHQKNNRRV